MKKRISIPHHTPQRVAGEEPHKLSDKAARLWESYQGPMSGAANAMNAAISNVQNILAGIILDMEGYSRDTHVFNVDNLTIIRKPSQQIVTGGKNGDNGG